MIDWYRLILDSASRNWGTLITEYVKGALDAQIAESGQDNKDGKETKHNGSSSNEPPKTVSDASPFSYDTLLGNADNANAPTREIVDPSGKTKTCYGSATFSAIGRGQVRNKKGALGNIPPNDTIAINPKVFGFPYATIPEREAAQKEIKEKGKTIRVHAPDLAAYLTGSTTFTIGDAGDIHIRNSPVPRFDIYRFASKKDADEFGKRMSIPVTITGVPINWKCPK